MCFRPRWNHWWYHQGRSSHASANTPLSRRYIIPLNQRKSFYLSFIFYNTESREDGAEAEAESLRSAFDDTGFTVVKGMWTHVDQLQEYVGHLLSMPVIHEQCNFLFACIRSHGKLGQLCGSESSSVSIKTIIWLFKQNMPLQIPLVSSKQTNILLQIIILQTWLVDWIFWEAVSRLNIVAPPSPISVAHRHLVKYSF